MAKAKLSDPDILTLGPMNCAAVSGDGAWIATGSDLGAFLWSRDKQGLVARCLLSRLEGKDAHGHAVESAAFAPDGSSVVFGTMGSALWSGKVAEMGEDWPLERWEQRAHFQPIRVLAFSADSKRLVACQQYGRVVVWEPVSREPLLEIDFPAFGWASACLSSDGRLVAVCNEEKAQVWDVDARRLLAETALADNEDWTAQPVFSPDAALLLVPRSRSVVQWRHAGGAPEPVFEADDAAAVRSLPGIGYAVFAGSTLRGFRAGTLDEVFALPLSVAPIRLAGSTDGRTVLVWSGAADEPSVWEPPAGAGIPLALHDGFIRKLAFSASGESLTVVAGGSFSSYLEEVACVERGAGERVGQVLSRRELTSEHDLLLHPSLPGGALRILQQGELEASALAKWPEGRRGYISARLGFSDLDGQSPAFVEEANDLASAVAISKEGDRVAVCVDERGAILVVEVKPPKVLCRLGGPGHLGRVTALAFSADGSWLASGGEDKSARVWDLKRRELKQTWRLHKREVKCVAMTASGSLLASGSPDKLVHVMRVGEAEPVHRFRCGDKVNDLVFSPDGELLLVATDQHLEVWNLETGKRDARGSSHWTKVVAVSGAGDLIATGSATLRLWKLRRK